MIIAIMTIDIKKADDAGDGEDPVGEEPQRYHRLARLAFPYDERRQKY
jgi:hypothetical protein